MQIDLRSNLVSVCVPSVSSVWCVRLRYKKRISRCTHSRSNEFSTFSLSFSLFVPVAFCPFRVVQKSSSAFPNLPVDQATNRWNWLLSFRPLAHDCGGRHESLQEVSSIFWFFLWFRTIGLLVEWKRWCTNLKAKEWKRMPRTQTEIDGEPDKKL